MSFAGGTSAEAGGTSFSLGTVAGSSLGGTSNTPLPKTDAHASGFGAAPVPSPARDPSGKDVQKISPSTKTPVTGIAVKEPVSVLKAVSRVPTANGDIAPLPFCDLYARLCDRSLDPEHGAKLAGAHMCAMLTVLSAPAIPSSPYVGAVAEPDQGEIVYRPGAATTLAHPDPSRSEKTHAKAVSRRLGIPVQDAAVLLRDFLCARHGESETLRLLSTADGSVLTAAPLGALEEFYRDERRFAYASLGKIFFMGGGIGSDRFVSAFAPVVRKHSAAVSRTVTEQVLKLVQAHATRVSAETAYFLETKLYGCVVELFFAIVHSQGLAPSDVQFFVAAIVNASKTSATSRYLPRRYVVGTKQLALFDGHRYTLLLCAALGSAMSAMHWPSADVATANGSHALQARCGKMIAIDDDTIAAIDSVLSDAPDGSLYAEVAIVRIMWGSYLAANRVSLSLDSHGIDGVKHGEYAFRYGSTPAIQALMLASATEPAIDAILEDAMRIVYWSSLHMQLIGFSPIAYPRSASEVVEDVELAVNILSGCGSKASEIASMQLWIREYSESERWTGSNALLRLAGAIFPFRFLPFVSLLAELCTDSDSAIECVSALGQRMFTRMEAVDKYRALLSQPLSDEEVYSLQQSTLEDESTSVSWFFRTASMIAVGQGDGRSCLVRSLESVESPYDNGMLCEGTVGLRAGDDETITWACRWNGWSAVDLALRSLHGVLSQPDAESLYDQKDVAELTTAAITAMRLVERICHYGPVETQQQVAESAISVELVCDLFLAVADSSSPSTVLTAPAKRAELLSVAGICLHTLTRSSTDRARIVVNRITMSAARSSALQSCVTALGVASFPALSAVARIANTVLLGSVQGLTPLSSLGAGLKQGIESPVVQDSDTGACRVSNFICAMGLPLWLSLYHNGNGTTRQSGVSGHWLLPATALELFSRSPVSMMDSPTVASIVATTLVSLGSNRRPLLHMAGSFQVAALHRAVDLCVHVLEVRNASLDDMLRAPKDENDPDTPYPKRIDAMAFEKMLLEPEVVHALAVLASGASGSLASLGIATMHAGTAQVSQEKDHASLCDLADELDDQLDRLQDMAAHCLSLFMTCLFKKSQCFQRPIEQVPWPAMGHSSLGCWFGGGEAIRKGFASRVMQGRCTAVCDFLTAVVSCGQRAAARALLGPASGKAKSVTSAASFSEEDARRESEVLCAVVDRLNASVEEWVSSSGDVDGLTNVSKSEAQQAGDIAISIASCVRVLRSAWEVHGGVWLKDSWAALSIWKHLSSLLRCTSGSPAIGQVLDLKVPLKGLSPICLDDLQNSSALDWTEDRINVAVRSFDTHSVWRGIIAEILSLFSSEVVFRCNDLAKPLTMPLIKTEAPSASVAAPELGEQRVRQEVFDDAAFAALREAFTEQWMHVFLDTSHLAALRSNAVPFAVVDVRDQTIEDATACLADELKRLLGSGADGQLLSYRRSGQVRLQFGGNYVYCMQSLRKACELAGIDAAVSRALLGQAVLLNIRWSRADAQLLLARSFSSLTTMIVMADSVAPAPNKMLTYASPQYCGKLCRVITHGMAVVSSRIAMCPSTAAIHVELATLLGFVSARLSTEELENAALSTVRFDTADTVLGNSDVLDMSPVARLAELTWLSVRFLRLDTNTSGRRSVRIAILQWLLLSGARLATGAAFRADRDVSAFGEAAMAALHSAATVPEICSAAGAALSAVVLTSDVLLQPSFGREGAMAGMFSTIETLTNLGHAQFDGGRVMAATDLVMFMTKMASGLAGAGSSALLDVSALEHLSSGSIATLLPSGADPVPAYNPQTLTREPVHRLWCSSLALATALISQVEPRRDIGASTSAHLSGVLEFASCNISRIAAVTLDSAGDWPPRMDIDADDAPGRFRSSRHLTMARVEEAELTMQSVFALADHAIDLRNALPHVVNILVSTSMRLVYQTYRLIRAEPIERWVRPVSAAERERSEMRLGGLDGAFPVGSVASPWGGSPVLSPGGPTGGSVNGSGTGLGAGSGGGSHPPGTSPRRNTQHALRAALGRLSGSRPGASSQYPPSPGMPSTPQHQSPMSVATAARTVGPSNKYQSPLSPWGSTGGGLITGSGVVFAEEVSLSMLRANVSALGALRRFSAALDKPLFAPTMNISESEPSVGLLVGIQFHACNELQRGCEGERRDMLLLMLEGALVLALSHAAHFSRHGQLTAGVRDEMHRRLETVVARMRRLVPPCPSFSIVHSDVDSFLRHFKVT